MLDTTFYIDINADVGEGIGNEAQLLPYLSSCNIACGGHAGNENSIRITIKLALQNNVKVGVHPSYPDTKNFGRISIQISPSDLIESIQTQISFFKFICEQEKAIIHHIKPHGALYNDIAKDADLAKVFLKAIKPYKNQCKLYVPYGSAIAHEALKFGFTIAYEAFLDRNYNADLSLVARKEANAMLENPKDVLEQLINIVKHNQIKTITGEFVKLEAQTYCIHGDTGAAFEILAYLHSQIANLPDGQAAHQIRIKK